MVLFESSSTALFINFMGRRGSSSLDRMRERIMGKQFLARMWSSSPSMYDENDLARPYDSNRTSSGTTTRIVDVEAEFTSESSSSSSSYHLPVMKEECISALLDCDRFQTRIRKNASSSSEPQEQQQQQQPMVFIDGTVGGGGHAAALLEHLSAGDVVIGCDLDSAALNAASDRLSEYMGSQYDNLPLFVPVRSNFCDLASFLPTVENPVTNHPILGPYGGLVDGILLDLGVSSYQIDTAERGFAFMKDGPLDMRMSSSSSESSSSKGGLSAAEICNELDVQQLAEMFKTYGDEPRAFAVAKAIVQYRPLKTTGDLVEAVASVTPAFCKKSRRKGRTATLARVFQSIRIVVNQEDLALEKALMRMSPTLLRPGGRLVVLSYHSMEDRAVKRVIRSGSTTITAATTPKDMYGNPLGPPRPFRSLGKPQRANELETVENPRARSATLRIAERTDS